MRVKGWSWSPELDRTPEMIEKVAKAIAARVAIGRGGHTLAVWDYSPERSEALDYAKAVLAVLREPTEEMLAAAHAEDSDDPITDEDRVFYRWVWRAMIDAILTEKSPIKE